MMVLHAEVINEPLVRPDVISGPLVIRVRTNQGTFIDSMPDPFEERGAPRHGEVAHFIRRGQSALFPVRIPMLEGHLPRDAEVTIYRSIRTVSPGLVSQVIVNLEREEGLELIGGLPSQALQSVLEGLRSTNDEVSD